MPTDLTRAIGLLEKKSNSYRRKILQFPKAKTFFKKTSLVADSLRQKSSRLLAGAGLVGALLTSPMTSVNNNPAEKAAAIEKQVSNFQKLMATLQESMPHNPTKLTPEQTEPIEKAIKDYMGIPVKAYLEDQSLNHHVGYMGFEQHLKRYPGDTLSQHDAIQDAGIAPGLGAWGYFAHDTSSFSTADYMREKYYCVAQTLYLENWNRDFKFLRDWYKYRKMLAVNPVNGKAVVCVLGDAGPAEWTGKQFGGSPETMEELDLNKGPRRGLVALMFIDDPDNKIPLGPVNYK